MPSPVDVTIVVPAYRAAATLGDCVASILAQSSDSTFELIVWASGGSEAELSALPADPRLTLHTTVPRVPAARARNQAVRQARGELLVFTDADVVVEEGWLENLVRASEGGRWALAGSVLNGTPWSLAGTTEYIVEFLDFHPRRPARGLWHGATCNLLVPRRLWEAYGPFTEGLDGGEDTILTTLLHEAGLLRFAPDAAVTHRNRTGIRQVVRHHYEKGRCAAHVARRGRYRARPLLAVTALAPVATLARLVSVTLRIGRWAPELAPRALLGAPLVVTSLAAWGYGLLQEGRAIDRAALIEVSLVSDGARSHSRSRWLSSLRGMIRGDR